MEGRGRERAAAAAEARLGGGDVPAPMPSQLQGKGIVLRSGADKASPKVGAAEQDRRELARMLDSSPEFRDAAEAEIWLAQADGLITSLGVHISRLRPSAPERRELDDFVRRAAEFLRPVRAHVASESDKQLRSRQRQTAHRVGGATEEERAARAAAAVERAARAAAAVEVDTYRSDERTVGQQLHQVERELEPLRRRMSAGAREAAAVSEAADADEEASLALARALQEESDAQVAADIAARLVADQDDGGRGHDRDRAARAREAYERRAGAGGGGGAAGGWQAQMLEQAAGGPGGTGGGWWEWLDTEASGGSGGNDFLWQAFDGVSAQMLEAAHAAGGGGLVQLPARGAGGGCYVDLSTMEQHDMSSGRIWPVRRREIGETEPRGYRPAPRHRAAQRRDDGMMQAMMRQMLREGGAGGDREDMRQQMMAMMMGDMVGGGGMGGGGMGGGGPREDATYEELLALDDNVAPGGGGPAVRGSLLAVNHLSAFRHPLTANRWPLVQGLRQSAVDALTAEQQLTAEQLQAFVDNDDAQCKICLMEYEVGDTLRRLPCQHV